MYSSLIQQGSHIDYPIKYGRSGWLHLVKGKIAVNHIKLQTGDGAGFSGESFISFSAQEPSEILLFDLPEKVVMETSEAEEKAVFVKN